MATLKDLAKDLREFKNDLQKAADNTNRQVASATIALLREYSSGTVKTIVLSTPLGVTHNENPITGKITRLSVKKHGAARGLGAPYGYGSKGWLGPRGPIPYGDPAWINKQSGRFERSWVAYRASGLNGSPRMVIQNIAPYAGFLEHGTKLMIPRPIDKFARAYIAKVGPVIFSEQLARAWKIRFDKK